MEREGEKREREGVGGIEERCIVDGTFALKITGDISDAVIRRV